MKAWAFVIEQNQKVYQQHFKNIYSFINIQKMLLVNLCFCNTTNVHAFIYSYVLG